MKRLLFALLLVSVACGLGATQSETPSQGKQKGENLKQHLLKLETEWADAEQEGDRAVLDRILADDYKFTDLDGKPGTKRELLDNLKKSEDKAKPEPKGRNDYDVQVYGTTAVVTHNAVFKGRAEDKDITVEARGMDVWVKHGAAWQVVAHQWTVVSGLRGDALPKSFLAECARMSFQPEVHSLFGDAAAILSKLENDTMGLPDRRGYLLLVETQDSAELSYFDRVSTEESRVYHWEGDSVADLREKLTGYIMANRGIACVGAQTKALVRASLKLSDLGHIPTPLTASAAFSHMIRKYGNSYLRVTVFLLC